ncbi:hypothetical protein GUITHDRAFT_106069 [Guillardia theta CCMP2712]|uniref:Fucosyltransferase n=1 Tax=Guillardia theta (strain CCMP2712) TaxID=905079 RepID=L1JHI4_GUITC|nr:hypothetical protein GUITHDRAFT_106069 [Guillardia theta CCMP2712]EKX47983.1 hypothetical protein GUITHDRAFT_106069 [Guillardia theta CCMP2712]|eukprot:XP_005834963.1 hypothetical protein GUITHDRAFT_106069 [Guillardia theta CCMP2712]
MESDTRRDILPANILPHLDLVANFRLHGDIPNTLETIHQDIDIGTPRLIEKSGKIIHHVTVTYTPGNLEMYRLQEKQQRSRKMFAAYLVSNCGRPRDAFIARLMSALGDDRLHSYGRCMNNRKFPEEKEHGSNSLSLLKMYKFTIAIENYLSHDYVSERFYQPLLAGSVPVYLGAPNIEEFAPGVNSFIDIRNFPSPEALASYLISLADNHTAYDSFFTWKLDGPSPEFLRMMNMSMTRGNVISFLVVVLRVLTAFFYPQVDLNRLHTSMCKKLVALTRREMKCGA